MSTNILLIIIIVLMVFGLLLQLVQLLATLSLPEHLFDSFFDLDESSTDIKIVDVEALANSQGFRKSKKSKPLKWMTPDKKAKKSAGTGETASDPVDSAVQGSK